MAAKTKGELLSLAEKEFDKLERVLETVGDDQAILKDDEDTSIKDVVAHVSRRSASTRRAQCSATSTAPSWRS